MATHDSKELTTIDETIPTILWSKNGETLAVRTKSMLPSIFNEPLPAWKIVQIDGSGEITIDSTEFNVNFFNNYSKIHAPSGDLTIVNTPDSDKLQIKKNGTTVTEVPGSYAFFEWSPDGKQLLLLRHEDYETQLDNAWLLHFSKATIYVVNADGSDLMQVSALGEVAPFITPAWSPDGSQIVFGSWLEDSDGDNVADLEHEITTLVSINKDGSDRKVLLDGSYHVTCVDW